MGCFLFLFRIRRKHDRLLSGSPQFSHPAPDWLTWTDGGDRCAFSETDCGHLRSSSLSAVVCRVEKV